MKVPGKIVSNLPKAPTSCQAGAGVRAGHCPSAFHTHTANHKPFADHSLQDLSHGTAATLICPRNCPRRATASDLDLSG